MPGGVLFDVQLGVDFVDLATGGGIGLRRLRALDLGGLLLNGAAFGLLRDRDQVDVAIEAGELKPLDLVRRVEQDVGDPRGGVDIRGAVGHDDLVGVLVPRHDHLRGRVPPDLAKHAAEDGQPQQHLVEVGVISLVLLGQQVVEIVPDPLGLVANLVVLLADDDGIDRPALGEHLRDGAGLEFDRGLGDERIGDAAGAFEHIVARGVDEPQQVHPVLDRLLPVLAAVVVGLDRVEDFGANLTEGFVGQQFGEIGVPLGRFDAGLVDEFLAVEIDDGAAVLGRDQARARPLNRLVRLFDEVLSCHLASTRSS
ncbi:MAG: hypothetical protein IPK85_01715 [Gemmatimonadetes bacterium]|nr:hypothetical protein [Gemmatimonadota bacterium]